MCRRRRFVARVSIAACALAARVWSLRLVRTMMSARSETWPSRRGALSSLAGGGGAALLRPPLSTAADWNSSPYTRGCSRLPRTIEVEVADPEATVTFLTMALGMRAAETPSGTAVSFGPTELRQPAGFYPGISSFDEDGGHCAIVVRRGPGTDPGTGLAYVQISMPFIRASKLFRYGGNVTDAYGVVNVIAPGGLPLRLLVGDEITDRCMYVALRAKDVYASAQFLEKQLGMRRLDYPRARPPTKDESPFDPNPPRGSAFLGFCPDSLGILLLPTDKNRFTGSYASPWPRRPLPRHYGRRATRRPARRLSPADRRP